MFTKCAITILVGLTLVISVAQVTSAQTGELRGHVVIMQADGQTVPASEATIDVYRTDISGKYNTKANKKGEFVFAGLPFVGTYTVVASHPTSQFNWKSGVKVGRGDDYEIQLSPGNGKRPTLDDIKALEKQSGGSSAPSGASGSESSEAKAKREELMRKNAELEAANKKIEESNVTIERSFKAGNQALTARKYDEAIKQYDEGLALDSNHPGVASLLTNKSVALRQRGVDRYNTAIKLQDQAAIKAGLDSAKQDWQDAVTAATRAVELLKAQATPAEPGQGQNQQTNKYYALLARAEAMRYFVPKVDSSQADTGIAAFQEYIAAETDPAKKLKAQMDAAQMLLDAGAGDKAFEQFKSVLAEKPDDPDANLGAGLALYSTNDKAKYQEAANYLQRFVDKAPDTHKDKEGIKAVLAELKNTENIVPEKTPTPARRRRP